MKDQGMRSDMWRWYCGGTVVVIAVVLGCATAVEFKDSKSAHVSKTPSKVLRGVAAEPGQEPMHNGGKMTMPVEASFDGDSILPLTSDADVVISITASDEIRLIQGGVVGEDGLKGLVGQPFPFTQLAAGEMQPVIVRVPAKTGSLVVRIEGVVNGVSISKAIELKVVNPKEPKNKIGAFSVQGVSGKPSAANGGVSDAVTTDSSGQIVQPMSATEN